MDRRELRFHIFEAFKAANVLDTRTRSKPEAFVDEGLEFELATLEMDSLAMMEFCIDIEMSLGVTMVPAELEKLATTAQIERFIAERLP